MFRLLATASLLSSSVFLTGCLTAADEEAYGTTSARLTCQATKECNRAFFVDEYSDLRDCIDDAEDNWKDQLDLFDDMGCDYDKDEGQKCLEALSRYANTCEDGEDLGDDCNEVFDCT